MKKIIILLVSIVLLVLDNTILPFYFAECGFPSLLFVFAISLSIIRGKDEAIIIGIISGFLQDIFFFRGFGVNMLLNMLLCVLAASIGNSIFKQNRLIPVIACFIISVLKVFGVVIILQLFSESINIRTALVSSILNSIVMMLVYKKVFSLSEKYFETDKWRLK